MPNFKYSIEIKKLNLKSECPAPVLTGRDATVFRFSYEDINHPDFLKPQYCKNPPRKLPADDAKSCDGYGLSVFESIEQSVIFFNEILNDRLRKLLGYTHIAQGLISINDGVTTSTDEHGHFNLHEFENIDLNPKFMILQPIPIK